MERLFTLLSGSLGAGEDGYILTHSVYSGKKDSVEENFHKFSFGLQGHCYLRAELYCLKTLAVALSSFHSGQTQNAMSLPVFSELRSLNQFKSLRA